MSTPNYRRGVGRLVADRYDFANHTDGYAFKHKAGAIDLYPTVTISSVVKYNVQSAIEALNAAISVPSVPDATTTTKGILKLAGDLSGTATSVTVAKLAGGYPLSIPTTPTTNHVLTWNGSAWVASAAANVFTAGTDLSGSNTNQNVIALTGSTGTVSCKADAINFISTVVPAFTQTLTNSGNGVAFSITAQESTVASNIGGIVKISGGTNSASNGFHGGVQLQMGGGRVTMLDITELAAAPSDPHRRVLSLLNGAGGAVSNTEMPNGTGNMVIYIRNALTAPTTGNPVNGAILYASGGKLNIKESSGNTFTINDDNKIVLNAFETESDGYSGGWTSFFDAIDGYYVDAFQCLDDYIAQDGDYVTFTYSGYIGRETGSYSGKVKFVLQGASTEYDISEEYYFGGTSTVSMVTITGKHIIISEDGDLVRLKMQIYNTDADPANNPISLFGSATLMIEAYRV